MSLTKKEGGSQVYIWRRGEQVTDEIDAFDVARGTSRIIENLPPASGIPDHNITNMLVDGGNLFVSQTSGAVVHILDLNGDVESTNSPIQITCPDSRIENARNECVLGPAAVMNGNFYQLLSEGVLRPTQIYAVPLPESGH